ncbi:MAG: Major Facilitator Superfamily protein [Lentisphaerae bacterium ADurb.Bin082]|nr:MAG: Major Facilitator Superfamily protein [Lentisphaerae bacterium ADurb.Bin082]HQL87255.1 MFS transporter [Lentisphaeria bacterium]
MTKNSKATIIYTTAFVMALTINAVNLALVFYSKEKFQATPTQTGILTACYNISYVVACIALRRVISRLAIRWSMILATGSFLVGILFMYCAKTIGLAYFGQCICGVGTAFFWPPLMGWLSVGLEGQALSRATGIYNFSWSMGCIISPMLTGYLSSRNASYPLVMGIISYLLAFVFFVAHRNAPMLVQAGSGGGDSQDSSSGAGSTGAGVVMRYPAWVGIACTWVGVGFILFIYPRVAEDVLKLNREQIGVLLLLRALAMSLAMSVLGFCRFWHFKPQQLLAGHLITIVALIGLGVARNVGVIGFLLVVSGLMSGHSYTNSIFHGVSGSSDRTFRMTLHEILLAAGGVVGAVLGGLAYQHFGLLTACLLAAGVMLVAVLADLNWWKAAKQERH